ncbi:MAG: GHKL domain-containing protein [Lachnospiraceae bacterium]|nr:GHKL domain-containing protein [Lachnospiraceae bacterium]
MLNNLTPVSAVTTAILTALLIIFFMERIVGIFIEKKRTSMTVAVLTYAGVFLFLFLTTRFVSPNINVYVALLYDSFLIFASCYAIALNYKFSTTRRIIVALSALPVFFSSNLFASIFVRLIFQTNIIIYETGIILVFLISPLFAVIIATLLCRFKNIEKNMAIAPIVTIFILAITMFGIYMIHIFMFFVMQQSLITDSTSLIMLTVMSAMPLGFSILLFYIFDFTAANQENKIKSALHAQEKEYYYTQCQLMQESAEQIKAVRHDMKIHLATLKDFTACASTEDIRGYLDSLVVDIGKSEVYSNTGNIAFDSIINYKLRNAKSDNIILDLNAAVPPELNVEVADIVTILGNLLDNALEAVANTSEKYIKLDIKFSKGGLFVKIENPFDGEVIYNEDKTDNTIVSSKIGNEHGYGLKNIKQSVEKYNGHTKITHTDNIFSIGIFLYVAV